MSTENQKEQTIEEKLRIVEHNLNHAKALLSRATEKFNPLFQNVTTNLDITYDYQKNDLNKELLEVTARIVRSKYTKDEERIQDLIKQAYLTGKLETLTATIQTQRQIVEFVKALKPFVEYADPKY